MTSLRASDAERDRVVVVLQEAHVSGRLDMEEFEERQAKALAGRYVADLLSLVEDLPEGIEVYAELSGDASARSAVPARRAAPSAMVAPGSGEPEFTVSIMSGKDMLVAAGTPAVRSIQWWGGDDYDLSEVMGPGVELTLELYAVMAGSEIWVPEGVRVLDQTVNIMAGNSIDREARGDGSNGTLILKGFSWWAGHEVHLGRPSDE